MPNWPEVNTEVATPTTPYRLSLSDALKNADVLFTSIDEMPTRKPRMLSSVDYITSTKTRSGNVDTLLYIVNYADNNGFAILAADTRLVPIYGISTEGEFNLNDTVENKGLAMVMEDIRTSAQRSTTMPLPGDSLPWTITPINPPGPIKPEFGERKLTCLQLTKPKLSKYASEWSQGKPFNLECYNTPPSARVYFKVGCYPLAAAQVMSYFQWPTNYEGINLDWSAILNWFDQGVQTKYSCHPALQKFLYQVGRTLGAKHDVDFTGLTDYQFKENFHKFGYEPVGNYKILTHAAAAEDVKSNPLIVTGAIQGDANNRGHAWVIDGYASYKEEWDAIDNETHTNYYFLFHFVWGLGGCNNGYFTCPNGEKTGMNPFACGPNDFKDYKLSKEGLDSIKISNRVYHNLIYWSHFVSQR